MLIETQIKNIINNLIKTPNKQIINKILSYDLSSMENYNTEELIQAVLDNYELEVKELKNSFYYISLDEVSRAADGYLLFKSFATLEGAKNRIIKLDNHTGVFKIHSSYDNSVVCE